MRVFQQIFILFTFILLGCFPVLPGCNLDNSSAKSSEQGKVKNPGEKFEQTKIGSRSSDKKKSFTFVVLGDTGTGAPPQREVAKAIGKVCHTAIGYKKCSFGIILGDLFYPTGVSSDRDPQFEKKFVRVYHFLKIPFYITPGNHDYGGFGGGYEFQKNRYLLKYAERDPLFIYPESSYYFHYKNTTFISINTPEIYYQYREIEHRKIVKKAIAEAKKRGSKWIIAFGHHTYISNAKHGNAGNYGGLPTTIPYMSGYYIAKFFRSELCYKIDLYLAGHDHNRQLLAPKCGVHFAVSGSGALSRPITDPERNPALFQTSKLGIILIKVSDEGIKLMFYDKNSKLEFQKVLKKK